jgi:hypothetical protein
MQHGDVTTYCMGQCHSWKGSSGSASQKIIRLLQSSKVNYDITRILFHKNLAKLKVTCAEGKTHINKLILCRYPTSTFYVDLCNVPFKTKSLESLNSELNVK